MLPKSALQSVCHAGVKGHIGGACQDVYIVHAVLTPILSLRSRCAHWLWQSVSPVLCAGVLRMTLLRCPKFLRCLTADAGNFDRGHSLTSLLLPLAALSSLPTTSLRTGLGMTRKFFRLSVIANRCAHWLWQSVSPVLCAGVLRMTLLRCPKFLRCLTADAGNFDRGHSLTSLLLPLAALSSLPTTSLRTGLGMTRKFFRLSVIANRCAHWLWQSVSLVPCARGITDSHDSDVGHCLGMTCRNL